MEWPDGGTAPDEGEVLYDYRIEHPDGAIEEVYIRRVPETEQYPSGIYYRMHFGYPDDAAPIIQFDNGHGYGEHHKHTPEDEEPERIELDGIEPLIEEFQNTIDEHTSQ